jgi:hypothetical protein
MWPWARGFTTASATLARLEGQAVFQALAERFPSRYSETAAPEDQPSITFRSLPSLPVTVHERGACGPMVARIGDDHRMTQSPPPGKEAA